jgi:hypothetical protein
MSAYAGDISSACYTTTPRALPEAPVDDSVRPMGRPRPPKAGAFQRSAVEGEEQR